MASFLLLSRAENASALPIVSGDGAEWGLKESLRDYVEEGGGSIVLAGGATRDEDGGFRFPVTGGSYDPESGSTLVSFGGSVQLRRSHGQFDLRMSGLSVELAPDGAWLFADMSLASSDGAPVEFPNAVIAELDASDVEPTVAGGKTTWSAIPAALTPAGASALSNLYAPGRPLDAFTFSYQGPGGKPAAAGWVAPGTPTFEQLAGEATPDATVAMFLDRDHELLHVISPAGLRALSRDSLDLVGATSSPAPLPSSGYAYDPDGTVFAVPDSPLPAPVRAFTWNATLGVYEEEELPIDADSSTRIAYDKSLDTLFAVEGTGFPATPVEGESLTPTVALAARSGGGWSALPRPPLETGDRGISSLTATANGSLVATMFPFYYVEPPAPEAVYPTGPARLFDNGSSVEVRGTWGGTPPAPPEGLYSSGYSQAVAASDGTVTLVEPSPPAPTAHAVVADPDGWSFLFRNPFELGPGARNYVIDDVNNTGYALKPGLERITVFREAEAVATISAAPAGATALKPSVGLASGDVLYFHNEAEPEGVYAYRRTAESATVLSQPQHALATLAAPDGSTSVVFSAQAAGDPTPTMRWQRRPAGSAVWADVPRATSPTLWVKVSAAATGDRYRAIFTNAAGEVATRVAILSVRVLPSAREREGGEQRQAAAPVPGPPSRRAKPPLLRAARGAALVVRRNGTATLAWAVCPPPLPCLLEFPRRVTLRVDGDEFGARVIAPKRLLPARSEAIKLRLPRPARKEIADAEAKATVDVTISSGEHRLSRTVTGTLRGHGL